MAADNPEIQEAAIFPSFEQIAMLANQEPGLSLAKAIELFAERYASILRKSLMISSFSLRH